MADFLMLTDPSANITQQPLTFPLNLEPNRILSRSSYSTYIHFFLAIRQLSTSTTTSNESSTFQDKYVFKGTLFLDKHYLIVLSAMSMFLFMSSASQSESRH